MGEFWAAIRIPLADLLIAAAQYLYDGADDAEETEAVPEAEPRLIINDRGGVDFR